MIWGAFHGGLLALRDEPSHRQAMDAHGIGAIDVVAVNLGSNDRGEPWNVSNSTFNTNIGAVVDGLETLGVSDVVLFSVETYTDQFQENQCDVRPNTHCVDQAGLVPVDELHRCSC